MHLPGPFRAAVGLVVSVADGAKHLPDRAIELPMLAVSSALQMSLRAQQRYARLTARGDEVLHRTQVGDEPPQWATFDEPVSVDELRRTSLAHLDRLAGDSAPGRVIEELFGVDSPGESTGEVMSEVDEDQDQEAIDATPDNATPDNATPDNVTPIAKAKGPSPTRKKGTAGTASSTAKLPTAKRTASGPGKTVNKPRHTAPSKFDDVDD